MAQDFDKFFNMHRTAFMYIRRDYGHFLYDSGRFDRRAMAQGRREAMALIQQNNRVRGTLAVTYSQNGLLNRVLQTAGVPHGLRAHIQANYAAPIVAEYTAVLDEIMQFAINLRNFCDAVINYLDGQGN